MSSSLILIRGIPTWFWVLSASLIFSWSSHHVAVPNCPRKELQMQIVLLWIRDFSVFLDLFFISSKSRYSPIIGPKQERLASETVKAYFLHDLMDSFNPDIICTAFRLVCNFAILGLLHIWCHLFDWFDHTPELAWGMCSPVHQLDYML